MQYIPQGRSEITIYHEAVGGYGILIKICGDNHTTKSHFLATLWWQDGSTSGSNSAIYFYTKHDFRH